MKTNRRKFLRLAGITSLGAALNACSPQASKTAPPAPTSTNTPAPTAASTASPSPLAPTEGATLTPEPKITLGGSSADVWAWSSKVSGRLQNVTCPDIKVQANGQPSAAVVHKDEFQADVPIQPGENTLKAVCQNGDKQSMASDQHVFTGRLRGVPVSNIKISANDGRIVLDGNASAPAPQDPQPVRDFLWSIRPDLSGAVPEMTIAAPADLAGKPLKGLVNTPRLEITPPAQDGEYYISLKVVDPAGRSDISTTYFTVTGGKPVLADWAKENTAWVENAIVYGVIPRNFGDHGFQSITDRLDSLQDLGVNAVWLAPVNVSPPGDYGYAVMDYFNLNPKYGTKDDFHKMVEAAHQRGIRVLMDFVPNHTSDKHPYFQDTLKYGQDSHYWPFYDRDETGAPTHYFDWTNLLNLNYSNPEVETWMTEAFAYWVREFDIDGFRVDACWGVQQRKPDYWPRWRQALKRIKPDLLLLAEASARDPYWFNNGFDAAYDWTDQLGKWAWELVFPKQTLLVYNLDMALTNANQGFDPDALIFRFLNNNDTGDRFITKYGPEMTRVATVLLLTLPGIPCVYTGDEVGAEFTPYGDSQPINWEDTKGLRDFHKQLIHLRRDTPALHSRQWQILTVEPHKQVYAYLRFTGVQDDQPILVLLNFSPDKATAEVQIPKEFAALYQKAELRDLLSGEKIPAGSAALKIEMPAQTGRIISA